MELLFGWNKVASKVPPKITTFDHILKPLKLTNNKIAVCYDGSGSTAFNTTKSYDGKPFDKIYAEALKKLQTELPDHDIICWSSVSKLMDGQLKDIFKTLINSEIPFSTQITEMNSGTQPSTILPYVQNKTSIIITDGEIGNDEIEKIQRQLSKSDMGPVFLVIVPHIDTYRNMYNNVQMERNAKDNIRLSIPQAFANKLASVLVWNYCTKTFEFIQELTAPWAKDKTLKDLLSSPMPLAPAGEFLIEKDGQYKTFLLDSLIDWLSNNQLDETVIEKLVDYKIKESIKQQALLNQKEKWNNCVQQMFNKIISLKVKENHVEIPIQENAPIVEIIQNTRKNNIERSKIEKKYRDIFGDLCGKLLIDKTVSEMSNIAQARVAQTAMNVAKFQNMKNDDKLDEIAPVLPLGNCSICEQQNVNVYKTINVPSKLFVELPLSKVEKNVQHKNKMKKIMFLDNEYLKNVLDNNRPRFHCIDLCAECAKISLERARLHDDGEYFVTNLVPQNVTVNQNGIRTVSNRLMLLPLVDPNIIDNAANPNDPKLSFSRQWLRGIISKITGLEPASHETMKVCLAFLTKLATDKLTAQLVFGTQVSLLRGGAQDKYNDLVGRLFKPSMKPLNTEAIIMICSVLPVIELAEMKIMPESTKLLLLCLLDSQISPLIDGKIKREKAMKLLDETIDNIIHNKSAPLIQKFNMMDNVNIIKTYNSSLHLKETNEELYNKFLATYLQNVVNLNFGHLMTNENKIAKILKSEKIEDVADALRLNIEYLVKTIERSKMTIEQFMQMIPRFLNDLVVNDEAEKMEIYKPYF